MSSSPTIFRRLLDIRLLAALAGIITAYHGWQGGLVVYVTGLGLLFLAQWMERNIQRVARRLRDPADIAP